MEATSRKDAKDLKTTDEIPYTIPPKAAPLVKDTKSADTIPYTIPPKAAPLTKDPKERYLKATHGKLTNSQKEIIAEVMSSESKEDANLKSFIDQKIIADEELSAATAAYATASAQQLEASVKVSELETKLGKALDMKDVTRAEASSTKSIAKDSKAPRALSTKAAKTTTTTTTISKSEVKAELKSDKKELAKDSSLSKSSKKEIKSEIKSDKSADTIPYTIPPKAAPLVKDPKERYLKATHGKLTNSQKEIIAEVMSSESKEDANLKSFIDQKIIADEELAAATATMTTAAAQQEEASVKVTELESKLAKALDMKDVTRAEASSTKSIASKSSSSSSSKKDHRKLDDAGARAAPAPKDAPAAKAATMSPPKKADAAPKEEKKDVDPREEIDGAKAKKTSKPTVKPTTPPKPTVPPTTKKPSEKKVVNTETEKVEGPKQHPASRLLAEVKKAAAPAPKDAPAAKAAVMSPPKKVEAPKEEKKEEKKDVEPREEIDGAKAKKTSKPTVKPTTPPKPTVPPTTKKPSEKKVVLEKKENTATKTSPFSSRMLSEVRGKVTPSSSSVRGSKGKTEKPVEGPPAPHAEPKGPRALSAVPVTKDDVDPCHDGLSPRCTPPTSKPVEHNVKRSLAGSPTKSPSSGLHKPTWKPSSKPNEHRTLAAVKVIKDDADPCHDGLSPRCTPPTSKPVEHASKQAAALPRTLAAVPVKVTKDDADPCHDGLSPRCTPPTSKPVEHRGLSSKTDKPSEKGKTNKPAEHASKSDVGAALPRALSAVPVTKDDVDPCHDGLSPRCTPPTSKPVEHNVKRSLAGSPTKSPSSGLHKPTWKPSSKPNEHR